MPYSTVQQATAQQATDVGPGRPAEGNDRNDDSQIRTKTSMHELTAARWRAQGSLSEEGSAYFQHLANIRKRTRVQPQQPQQPEANDISLSDHNEPHSVSAGHLSDQELSWRLSWHQGMAVQDCLPAYDLSSSAACSSVQAAAQQQQAAPSLGDLSQSMPQQSIHLQIMSQQLLLGSQDLHPSAQSLGRNLLQANTSSQQDSPLHGSQDLRPPPSQNNKHDQMPLSAGLQSFAPQLQSQPELHTHTATMSQRHAFERPNGRSAFSLPFMNAPHSVHNRRQGPGAVAACSLAGAVTPMDVCQDHSLASTSTTNAGAWQNAVASAAGQGVLPHLRPPVNLVFQVCRSTTPLPCYLTIFSAARNIVPTCHEMGDAVYTESVSTTPASLLFDIFSAVRNIVPTCYEIGDALSHQKVCIIEGGYSL